MKLTPKFLLLLQLLLIWSHHVDSGSIVKFLPGFEGPLPFELETGYIGIGEEEEVQSFYYFIKSEKNPKEDPLILWFSGGPACSAMSAFVFQNGPLALKSEIYNGSVPSLVSTPYSWTKMASVIYLDQPVKAGFSYSRTPIIDKPSDTGEFKRIHEFIQKWLSRNPQFYSNPFYVAGDSYAGMIVPAVVDKISRGNYLCCEPPINLQGYVLGDPATDYEMEQNYRIQFSHGMALISDELFELMKRACKGNYVNVDPINTECLKLVEEYHKCTENINQLHILLPNCADPNTEHIPPDCFYYPYYLIERWANDEGVREALYVEKGRTGQWVRCNRTFSYNGDTSNSVPYHMNNSINGYRSLIYSGDHDMAIPLRSTQAWIESLNYSIIQEWRPWLIKDQITGYTSTYSNKMTFATIKGGGHTSEYSRKEAFIMFQRWINYHPL